MAQKVNLASSSVAKILNYRLAQLVFFTGILTTYAISPWSNYDPISLPKMFTLSIGAIGILFYVLGSYRFFESRFNRTLVIIVLAFIGFMLSTLAFSGHNILAQIWGTFGRNTGLLTYLSLLTLLVAAQLLQDLKIYERLLFMFVLGVIPMTIYCTFQFFGRDPIGWSEKAVFGTLGNINFLSAYFGITSVAAISLAVSSRYKGGIRLLVTLLAIINISLATSTNSIQGPIIFISGIAAIVFFYVTQLKRRKVFSLIAFLAASGSALVAVVYALFNKGPLASIIFQPSVIFRGDYMHAGWRLMIDHPLFGVGMDNYGDWYRQARGEISTLRTGPGRISNTAHNILLDVGSNGGIPLAAAYLLLILVALISIIGFIRKGTIIHPVVMASSAAWIAYQIQALVSINQIGVGVWGWIFSGVLIGLSKTEISSVDIAVVKTSLPSYKDLRGKTLPAKVSLQLFAGTAIGAIIAFPPLNADTAYRAAANTGQFENIYKATQKLGSTEFHGELLLEFSQSRNLASEVRLVAEGLLKDYPRNFFAWRLLSVATTGTDAQRLDALNKARELDPFNPELR